MSPFNLKNRRFFAFVRPQDSLLHQTGFWHELLGVSSLGRSATVAWTSLLDLPLQHELPYGCFCGRALDIERARSRRDPKDVQRRVVQPLAKLSECISSEYGLC